MKRLNAMAIAISILAFASGCSTVSDVLENGVNRCCTTGSVACAAVVSELNVAIAPNEVHVHCAAIPTP